MKTIINSRVGENKGHLRVWLEGGKLLRSGYAPDDKYNITVSDKKIMLTRVENGIFSISRRLRNGRILPLIEITGARCKALNQLFKFEQLLRVVVTENMIVISQHHVDIRSNERETRLAEKILNQQPLSSCALFFGYGMLDRAAHDGMEAAGIRSRLSVAVEREAKYLDSAVDKNGKMFDQDTYIIESPIQFARISESVQVDCLIAGIPCTGASKAGKAKNKNKSAEDHPDAGAMVYYTLKWIEIMNPAIVALENVCEYSSTESMAIVRSVLGNLGYNLYELVLSGHEFGCIEDRKRLCVFAVSKGLGILKIESEINDLSNKLKNETIRLSDMLDPIELDDAVWKSYDYLASKEQNDIAAGKGFRRQLLTGNEAVCGTIGRHYNKARSTEPFIQHPENAQLSRLLSVKEHARVKGFPTELLDENMSTTTAHEALGQGVIYPAFKAAFQALGNSLWQQIDRKIINHN
ncbi:TPA: DNA cytosine methyltransferase [Yersinia enterocolitica]